MSRLMLWGAGFVALFLINALVELVLLPAWGLDQTDKNDIYFQCWWAAVAVWLLCGNAILKSFERPTKLA